MTRFVTELVALFALTGAFACEAPLRIDDDYLERAVLEHADRYAGGIDATATSKCTIDAGQGNAVHSWWPNTLLAVNDIWLEREVPALPVVGGNMFGGVAPETSGVYYATFDRVVIDPSVRLECGGERITEALLVGGVALSGLYGRGYTFTIDDVKALVTKHQTATALPELQVVAEPVVPEQEP